MAVDYEDVAEEFEDVQDASFARTLTWVTAEQADAGEGTHVFIGSYQGPKEKTIKGKTRRFNQFIDESGEEVEAWGTTILDGRLDAVEKSHGLPARVRIEYLGKNAPTSHGTFAHNFRVGASKRAAR